MRTGGGQVSAPQPCPRASNARAVPASINSFTQIIYGVILVVILMARPEGIITRELPGKIKRLFARGGEARVPAGRS